MKAKIAKSLLLFSFILITLYSCTLKQHKSNEQSSIEIENKIDSILSLLTLKEKVDM